MAEHDRMKSHTPLILICNYLVSVIHVEASQTVINVGGWSFFFVEIKLVLTSLKNHSSTFYARTLRWNMSFVNKKGQEKGCYFSQSELYQHPIIPKV